MRFSTYGLVVGSWCLTTFVWGIAMLTIGRWIEATALFAIALIAGARTYWAIVMRKRYEEVSESEAGIPHGSRQSAATDPSEPGSAANGGG